MLELHSYSILYSTNIEYNTSTFDVQLSSRFSARQTRRNFAKCEIRCNNSIISLIYAELIDYDFIIDRDKTFMQTGD